MAVTVPTLKVEIAFATTNAFDTAPTWTDVSSYVLNNPGCSIQRGRANELSTFSSGRATLTLNNQDGRFSPLNASSPYVGQLLPRKQIRISATWAATDYVLFRGYVTGWPQEYSRAKKMAMVPLECYDAFAILNETTLQDMYYGYMKTGIGSLAASLRRLVGRALVDQVSGLTLPTASSNVTGAADLSDGLSGSDAVVFDGTFKAQGSGVVGSGSASSYSMWVKTSSAAASTVRTIVGVGTGSSGTVGVIGVNTAGKITATVDTGGTSSATSTTTVNDNQVHHVVVVFNGATANTIYIDGVDSTATQTPVAVDHGIATVGGLIGLATYEYFDGTIQDVALFNKALSSTEARTLYLIGLGNVRDDTASRFARVLDSAGWPSSWRAITTQPYGTCVEVWSAGDAATAQLQLVAATEQGAMFVTRDGNITLKSRYTHDFAGSAAKVVQCTLSDDGADSTYVDVGFDYDDLLVQNYITVTSQAGSAFFFDQTSIDKYGLQDTSITTQLGSYGELRSMAEGLIYWRKDPQIRTRPVTVYPQTKTSTWPTILGLDLGYRIQVELTPPGVGAQYSAQQLIQQLDWDISSTDWAFTVQGSPVPTSFGVWDSGDDFDASIKFGF